MSRNNRPLFCTVALAAGLLAANAQAEQKSVLLPGDAVVTGFSGIAQISPSTPTIGIDLNGPSAQIMSLAAMPGAPSGEAITQVAKRIITAKEVGQVFAIALDDAKNGQAPNIFLGATSLFGLHIVEGAGGERLEFGEPGAKLMDGQFGPGGTAGSIWKIDGVSGEISEFARLPGNSGAGVGDVVFDAVSRQFFATDLDNGKIYRISEDGAIIDTFDHGLDGRVNAGLAAISDDGSSLDINDATFDTIAPETWGYTQSQRRVWGMTTHNGRLYYATETDPQVWSVGIANDGSFAADAKLEFDVTDLSSNGPITDMLFDKSGRLYLAQRGPQTASFNFSKFAEPGVALVMRYVPSATDEDTWELDPDYYAIGMTPDHEAANGGVAIGYEYDTDENTRIAKCGGTLWSTGGRLVASDGSPDTPADIHGLQGNSIEAVRPENVPPLASYFIDYDGQTGDAQKAGHMGDVEVFQPCAKKATHQYPPGYYPPGDYPPEDWPPEFPPPREPSSTNLRLTKTASPKDCLPEFGGWSCQFKIVVRNTGPNRYWGDILVSDTVPGAPAGLFFGVGPVPPWSCWTAGAANLQCWRPNVLLNVGQYVELKVNVWLPSSYNRCRLRNIAEIEWAPGATRWNANPDDDFDGASARIPLPKCLPIHRPIGSDVHRPQGSDVHRPQGSDVHRPRGSDVHRPKGSVVHRPKGSNVHKPRGSTVHNPLGSPVHTPKGSYVHRPMGSFVHRPKGSVVHRPKGSTVHKPKGSTVHKAKGSRVHKPKGSKIHKPKGSLIIVPQSPNLKLNVVPKN